MKIKKSKINFIYKTKKINKLDFDIEKVSIDVLNQFIKCEKLKKKYTVDITITTNKDIQKINNENRNINKPTDVLSFPMMCDDFDTGTIFLGDVIISVDKLLEQAKLYNHSKKREYSFLLCHSLLHLIGYDHIKKTEEKIMFEKQDNILNKLKILR